MATAVVELNQQNDSSLASKSTRVHSSEDAVPVYNPSDEKNTEAARKCNHFSIRGYVSEVRKRDPKLCYPFTLKDSTDPRYELPSMVVPNFRWWRCISCVPEAKNDILKDSSGVAIGDQAHNNVVNPDASILLAELSSKVNNAARVRNTEASTSIDSNDNKNHSPISADRKGKGKAHVNDKITISSGFENGFPKVSSSQRIQQQTIGQVEVHLSTDNEVERRPIFNQNGTITARDKDSKAGRTEVGPSEGYVTHVPKTCQGEPTNAVARIILGSHSHSQGLVNLPDLNEWNGEPSYESYYTAIVTGISNNNNNFCEDDDDYMGAERRKKPKVRLLSELLGLKKPQYPGKRKKKTFSSASSQDYYVKRKRVDSQDEGLKSMEIEKSVETSELSESQYESDSDNVSSEIISKALAKRRCKSKDPFLEKRNKKIQLDQGDSSSLFKQKVKHKSSHGKGNYSEELPQNLDFFTRLSEKNSVQTKKRGTVSQAQKEPTSLLPSKSRMPNECETTQTVGETYQNGTENVQKASENGHYSLSRYLNKENDQLCVPRKDGLHLPSSQTEQKDKENTNIAETSVTFKLTSDSAPLIRNQFVAESNICLTANSSEKKIGIPETDGHRSLARHIPMQVSNPIAEQKELTNEARGRIQDIDINSIPSDDKTNEQGVADDIPMDIVELMAKNQYERHLDGQKDKHVISQPPDLSGTHVRQNGNGSCGKQMQNLAQFHFLNMKKPPLTDPRIPLFNETLGHCTYNNRNNLGVLGLSRENMVSGRFLSPSQALEHILPYSARAVTPNNWNQNLNAAIGQKYPPSFLQAVDSYEKHRGMAPRPQSTNESHHVWPSGMTSRMPLGITNPQIISQSSNLLNIGRINHQSSGSFLKFEKQHKLNFSNAYNVNGNPECSARSSVDVNEAIPAMHLLSLMQNAAKMQNTDLSLGPQKLMVSPTSSRYPFPKNNYCRTTAMQDNSRHLCYPAARPFPLTSQNDGVNIGKTSDEFMGHIPLTLRGQRNMENTHFAPPSVDHRPLRRPMGPPRDKRKAIASMLKPSYMDNPIQAMKHSLNLQCGGVRRSEKTVSLAPDKVICLLNQNPSEFNDLKLIAQYMIGPENLKPRKLARDEAPRPRGNSKRQNIKVNKPITSVTNTKR